MILGLDMDGVVADFISGAIKIVKNTWGLELTHNDVKSAQFAEVALWSKFSDEERAKYNSPRDLYNIICPKGFFETLNPIPGAVDAVERLSKFAKIVFVTKPIEWVDCPSEKRNWLKRYLPDIDYTVVFVNKMEDKQYVAVDVMVDDDPRVLSSLTTAIGMLIEQPWNKDYREENKVLSAKSLKEAVPILQEMEHQLRSPYLF